MEVKDPLLAALERNSVVVRTSVVSAFTSEVALAALEFTAVGGDPSSQWMARGLKLHGKGNGSEIESKSIRAG